MKWEAPKDFPNLSSAPYISFDLETCDPNLTEKGPGGARSDGYVLGYAIAAPGFKGYFPLRHPEGNLDENNTKSWLRATLGRADQPKIGANILYDMEWAYADGVPVAGPKYDIQIAEFLLDEERKTYRLDALGEAYFAEGKNEEGLAEAVRRAMGKKIGYIPDEHETKGNLWRLPAHYVGNYAEQDADLTMRIWEKQEGALHSEELWNVFSLESKVLDVLLKMRFRGIPIDLDRAHVVLREIEGKAVTARQDLFRIAGREINPASPGDVSATAKTLGLAFPRTEKGNPSFAAPWVRTQGHPFWVALAEAKQMENAGRLHVKEKIINMEHNGKLFPSFHPVKKEKEGSDGMAGTRKGRFSSSNPNVAQIPSRHPYLGPIIRSIFLPEKGEQWLSADWSQQEPRLTVHYAALSNLPGADIFRDRYRNDPNTDMHSLTAELAGIDRKLAKIINLGLAYGMGGAKLAASLAVPENEAREIMKKYGEALPFIKALGQKCSAVAEERGFIRTLFGRKSRYNFYGPARWILGAKPLRKLEAIAEWGAVRQWDLHKTLNNLVQGSGADMIKKAMVDCDEAGFTPLNTIYDELDFSVPGEKEAKQIKEIMLNVVQLCVPLKVDCDMGPSWGEAKEVLI